MTSRHKKISSRDVSYIARAINSIASRYDEVDNSSVADMALAASLLTELVTEKYATYNYNEVAHITNNKKSGARQGIYSSVVQPTTLEHTPMPSTWPYSKGFWNNIVSSGLPYVTSIAMGLLAKVQKLGELYQATSKYRGVEYIDPKFTDRLQEDSVRSATRAYRRFRRSDKKLTTYYDTQATTAMPAINPSIP